MQLSDSDGTEFYNFSDIKDEKAFKNKYRDALDNIPVTDNQIVDIIAEANIAFNLNMRMFQELDSNLIKVMVMLLLNTIGNLRRKRK